MYLVVNGHVFITIYHNVIIQISLIFQYIYYYISFFMVFFNIGMCFSDLFKRVPSVNHCL